MTAEQVKEALAKGEVTPVDVNGADTRSEYGMVPGALLLGDDGSTVATLGEDKARALVFYCGSERCGAAPRAAAAAVELGYTNVSVMKVGIRGWAAAGFDVTKPATN
jgi:rhodanese-related sulfurtransferase